MKAYTDLEQSKRLAEILPHKSADGTWERVSICGSKIDIPEDMQYRHKEIPFSFFSGIGAPSWSLAALLEIIKKPTAFDLLINGRGCRCHCTDKYEGKFYGTNDYCETPVDACVEVIIKLHKQKLL